jgi:hypothetical protein
VGEWTCFLFRIWVDLVLNLGAELAVPNKNFAVLFSPCRKMPTRHLKLRHDHIVVLSSSISVTVPFNRDTNNSVLSNPKAALPFNVGIILYCLMIIQIFNLLVKQVPFLTDTLIRTKTSFAHVLTALCFLGKPFPLATYSFS